MHIVLSDNQVISRAGLLFFIQQTYPQATLSEAFSKKELLEELNRHTQAVIILDYTLFDLTTTEAVLNIAARFPNAHFLLFSDELSEDFLRNVVSSTPNTGVLFKDADDYEIRLALERSLNHERYLAPRAESMLSGRKTEREQKDSVLTATEQDILRMLALGKSTKEIAQERFSSIHTITTHRKNIFRKLEVNTVYEATKYALRAGIVDSAEYYI